VWLEGEVEYSSVRLSPQVIGGKLRLDARVLAHKVEPANVIERQPYRSAYFECPIVQYSVFIMYQVQSVHY
jgi:hypothetical protein